ncbi:uncharacterized protein Z520_04119 [Fonsecaea multimorphosa CBS 102226]|uniref:GS catalytic domain-containing protein n=1 Tax=Fonsecaea multimorphosa CBS 102226 TaxID=1442371 RepID=A0A0D2KUP9_9EURO|nr:uncharacterized protein Z520_04119 [Fonsecaea multimorphosa CBS 102226]KIY00434.1 hypothetical protein Z520_04119 [Fonsecaea multimorphosa CBS 102226]
MNFQTPGEEGYASDSHTAHRPNVAAFLEDNAPKRLRPITVDNFGYSLSRPNATRRYFYDIFDKSAQFNCNIEGWHTETGPGVYEAALKVSEVGEIADRVSLFKYLVKSIGVDHNVTPCFMAKPLQGFAGNSGHVHVSLCGADGRNLFLASLLEALPDLMPVFAPTVNSYKRLVENYWAPVDLSWGLEDRLSSIRLIAPPVCKPSATRFEVRVPGADTHPHFTLHAILGAG